MKNKIIALFIVSIGCLSAEADNNFDNGMKTFKQAKYAQAAALFEQSYKSSGNITSCYYAALSYQYQHKYDVAKKLYQQIIDSHPESQEAQMAKQALSTSSSPSRRSYTSGTRHHDVTPAAHPTTTVATAQGTEVDELLNKADIEAASHHFSTAQGFYSDALRAAEKLGSTNPKIIKVLDATADFYMREQQTNRVEEIYRRELDLYRVNYGQNNMFTGEVQLKRARMYRRLGQYSDAKQCYYEAIDDLGNAMQDAQSKPGRSDSVARLKLADTLSELAEYIYNSTSSATGYGDLRLNTSSRDLEVARLRLRAEQLRSDN